MYTIHEKFELVALIILFSMIVIGGVFSANCVSAWLTNRREERKAVADERFEKAVRRADEARQYWIGLLDEKEKTNSSLVAENRDLQRRLARMEELLSASENERKRLMEDSK